MKKEEKKHVRKSFRVLTKPILSHTKKMEPYYEFIGETCVITQEDVIPNSIVRIYDRAMFKAMSQMLPDNIFVANFNVTEEVGYYIDKNTPQEATND